MSVMEEDLKVPVERSKRGGADYEALGQGYREAAVSGLGGMCQTLWKWSIFAIPFSFLRT